MADVPKKPNVAWDRIFVTLGVLAAVIAFGQSILQIIGLRLASKYFIIPYIWFFIFDTWATVIYGCYTIRLLYLVRYERSSELSRVWWYIAVAVMIVNPAQSVWWWLREDFILLYVSVPASFIYLVFFVLVCRSMASGKVEKRKKRSEIQELQPVEVQEFVRQVTTV